MNIRFPLRLGIAAAVAVGLYLAGCGDGAGQNSADEKKSVENAQSLRSFFDKARGNYDSLSAADKAEYIKQCGGEEKAQQNWNLMKLGPGAADRSGRPAASGGGTGQ